MYGIIKTPANNVLAARGIEEGLLKAFLLTQDVRGSSKNTYKKSLHQFFNWVHGKGINLQKISRVEILQYKDFLLTSGKSALTVGGYLTAVRRFFSWLEAEGYYLDVAKGIKTPRRYKSDGYRKQALSESKAKQFISHFAEHGSKRDYALMNLLIRCGLRTIEASRANLKDIEFYGGRRIMRLHGKGRDEKREFVVLTDKTYEPIRDYLGNRVAFTGDTPLFLSECHRNIGGRLSTRAISRIAKTGLKAIGLDGIQFTAHSLRHTTGCMILRAGGDLEAAQHVLRHANPATTQIYLETIKEQRRLDNPAELYIDEVL